MAPTHPKTSNSKRDSPSLKQVTLSFKSTKRGAATSLKAKAKSKSISRAKSEAKVEVDGDSQNISGEDSESGNEETPYLKRETLDMQDKSGKYQKYYREAKEKMGGMSPCQSDFHALLSYHSS
jgi:hypothetical protein